MSSEILGQKHCTVFVVFKEIFVIRYGTRSENKVSFQHLPGSERMMVFSENCCDSCIGIWDCEGNECKVVMYGLILI